MRACDVYIGMRSGIRFDHIRSDQSEPWSTRSTLYPTQMGIFEDMVDMRCSLADAQRTQGRVFPDGHVCVLQKGPQQLEHLPGALLPQCGLGVARLEGGVKCGRMRHTKG